MEVLLGGLAGFHGRGRIDAVAIAGALVAQPTTARVGKTPIRERAFTPTGYCSACSASSPARRGLGDQRHVDDRRSGRPGVPAFATLIFLGWAITNSFARRTEIADRWAGLFAYRTVAFGTMLTWWEVSGHDVEIGSLSRSSRRTQRSHSNTVTQVRFKSRRPVRDNRTTVVTTKSMRIKSRSTAPTTEVSTPHRPTRWCESASICSDEQHVGSSQPGQSTRPRRSRRPRATS